MTESGIAPNSVELPCDAEPPYVSPYLLLPRRSLIAAVRDVSAKRDLPIWTFDLIRPRADNLVSLASERSKRRG